MNAARGATTWWTRPAATAARISVVPIGKLARSLRATHDANHEARPRSTENTTSRSSSSREPSAVTARALSREGARGRVHTRRATKRAPFSGAFLGVFALAATSCPSRCLCHRLASRSAGDGFPCSRPAAKSKRDLLARSQQGRRLAIGAMIFRQTGLATKAALSSPKTARTNRRGRVGRVASNCHVTDRDL